MKPRTQTLVDRMLAGDRNALAKLMTMVENRDAEAVEIMSRLHGRYDRAYVVGITGPPGAGKSTLLDRLVGELRAAGRQIGIVAVDPSSPFSGGAVLGDRIRMQSHYLDPGVFIRSLSARGSMGGLARGARDVTRLLDAFGKDLVIVETVGVGQNEFDVMRLAQTVVVVLVPEAGDTVQTMKAGLLEIADIFVVNKADREGADRIESELFNMLHLRPPSGWEVPVLSTVATEGRGVAELVTAIEKHRLYLESSGEGAKRAAAGRRAEFLALLRDEIARRLEHRLGKDGGGDVLGQVERGEVDPHATALEILGDPRWMGKIVGDERPPEAAGNTRRTRDE